MPLLSWWPLAAAALGGSYHLWAGWMHSRRARRVVAIVLATGLTGALAVAATSKTTPPARIGSVIESFLQWAVEGRELPSDPPKASPALPHRNCGGKLDPQHPPATVYVAWQLSAEAQHAACNWKYDVASHHASPLSAEEAADASKQIIAGSIGPEQRAFFHSVPMGDGRLSVTAGYCWGSASGTFAFKDDRAILISDVAIHGY